MAKQTVRDSKKWYWVLIITVAMICLMIITMFSRYDSASMNKRYARPFESREGVASTPGYQSNRTQPSGPGLKESNIQKHKGNRYNTY